MFSTINYERYVLILEHTTFRVHSYVECYEERFCSYFYINSILYIFEILSATRRDGGRGGGTG
jgi:hypothetical protein